MDLKNINSIYFLGIGGIGMSALARYFHRTGKAVCGYDRTPTALTAALEQEGISIHYEEDVRLVPIGTDLVIYTPAIPADNREMVFVNHAGYPVKKRSEILGMLSGDCYTVAVAGTHGKTTITSMIAHILQEGEEKILALIGGIARNAASNLVYSDDYRILVVEADEYDRSFLKLEPDMAVISSIDSDHLDIYGNRVEVNTSFTAFASKIPCKGALVVHEDIDKNIYADHCSNVITYGSSVQSAVHAENIRMQGGLFDFNLVLQGRTQSDIQLGVPGRFNLDNAMAAAAVCAELGISHKTVGEALASYKGVERRFDVRINNRRIVYIDDYAHHPEEINSCIQAVREIYPGKSLTGIFQPHLFSRTRDLASEFATSLEQLDRVILLDIYPAREDPIPGVDSKMLLHIINHPDKMICQMGEIEQTLEQMDLDILLTMGAGDIDRLVMPLETMLCKRFGL